MKKLLTLSIALLLLALPLNTSAFAAAKAGASCTKVGSTAIASGKKFTCIKKGKKLVWDNGVVNKVSSPSSKPLPAKPVIADPELSSKSSFSSVQLCEVKSTLAHQANLGYGIAPEFVKASGDVNFGIIFTTYTDAAGDDRAFKEYKDVQAPNVSKFFSTASYGKLKVRITSTYKYYNINKSSETYNLRAMNQTSKFWQVVEDGMNAAKADYDFSKIDVVLVVMPSTAAAVDLGAAGMRSEFGGKIFYQGITSAYINPSNGRPVEPLFLAHEFGHVLGLLHPTDHKIGLAWDLMVWEQNPAVDLYGWEKFILNWIEPTQVDCLAQAPSAPLVNYLDALGNESSETKLFVYKISESQVLVVESRKKSSLDDLTPAEEGVLVYKVDVNLGSDRAPISLIHNGSPWHNLRAQSLLVGTLQQGESISSDGIKISVLKSTDNGDFVKISRN
jgi:M6 family metalloprotease-like protein